MGVDVLRMSTAGTNSNASIYKYENRWQKPMDQTSIARFATAPLSSDSYFSNSDGVWTDASFTRLQTLALAYRLPQALAKKAGMTSLSITINAQNIFVLTRYKGIDPEIMNFGSIPLARTITAGISAGF